jgi:hypothetical protein
MSNATSLTLGSFVVRSIALHLVREVQRDAALESSRQ